jgi:hypothetical protein
MELITLQAIDNSRPASRFKHSPLSNLVMALIFLSITLGIVWWYHTSELPLVILLISGGGCALFSLICFATFKKSLAPENWILSLSPQVVLIKFRSYLNAHFPQEDPQVAQFQLTEIESACMTKQTIKAPGSKNTPTTSFHTFLDLHITGQDLPSLKEQLKYERNVKMGTKGRFGTTSTKFSHYPVSVVGQQTVRIEWRSPTDRVTPGIKAAIKQLSRLGVRIEPSKKEVLDFTKTAMDQAAMEDQILQLAERGNLLQATKLTRRTLGLSLTESKAFVEDLLQ